MVDKASIESQLAGFGFSPATIERALSATGQSGLQEALDWLDEHGDDGDRCEKSKETSTTEPTTTNQEAVENDKVTAGETSLKCNACGKLFSSVDFAQLHASKSGHDDFSESSELVPKLSEGEKTARLAELRERLKAKRQAEQDQLAAEAKQNEIIRRKANKEAAEARRALQEKEMEKAFKLRMKEKKEDAELRARIKQQIEEDRSRVREREKMTMAAGNFASAAHNNGNLDTNNNNTDSNDQSHSASLQPPHVAAQPIVRTDQARIQVRLPSGQTIRNVFASSMTLSEFKQSVLEQASLSDHSGATLIVPFPPQNLDDAVSGDKTLIELGLCPSASLILKL